MKKHASISNRFSQSWRSISSISNRLETECRRDCESRELRPLLGCGVVMFWQAMRSTLGKARTFETRLENVTCEY